MILIYLCIFIFGLCIGSFLNVVILRLRAGEKFVAGRSRCPKCKKELSWSENIPLLSFMMLKGKCRGCHQKISWQYPLVELITGLIFVGSFIFIFYQNFSFVYAIALLLYYFFIISFLIIIFVYDLKYYLILDKIILPAIIFVFVAQGFLWLIKNDFSFSLFINYYSLLIFSAIIISGFFLSQYLISKGRWMGGGDIRLGFLMGLILGWPNCLVALSLAYVLGLIVAMPLLIFGKKKMSSRIPFGTLLSLATLSSLFWGTEILNWYLNMLYV